MYPEHNNYEFNTSTNEYVNKTKWIINTDGTNLEDLLIHPAINAYKTISNDIYEYMIHRSRSSKTSDG